MDQLNEILMETTNVTTTRFNGSNLGNRFGFNFSTKLFLIFLEIFTKMKYCVFYAELSLNHANLDENGIRFPEVSSSNTSYNANEMSTFLELPKQNINSSKGKFFICSKIQWLYLTFWLNSIKSFIQNWNLLNMYTIFRLIILRSLKRSANWKYGLNLVWMSTFKIKNMLLFNVISEMQYVAIIYKILPELLSPDHHRFSVFGCYFKSNNH